MIKKLIASGALAAVLALGGAGVAHASSASSGFNLAPGTQACIRSSLAASNVRAEGNVVSGHAVRFTLSATGPSIYGTLDDTVSPVTAWAAQHTSFYQPGLFPSTFQACAINQSLKYSQVNLSLNAG